MQAVSSPMENDARFVEAWHAIGDALPSGIAVTVGAGHRLRYHNPSFAVLTGVSEGDEPIGRSLPDTLPHAALRDRVRVLMAEVLETGRPATAEDLELRCGEAVRVCRCTVSLLVLDGDPKAGLVVRLDDVTESARARERSRWAEDEIREVNERLVMSAIRERELAEEAQAANRARSDFLAAISHELRTPLTAVIGYAELLESESNGALNERQRRSVDRINYSALHLRQLINEILDFQRMEAGKLQVQCMSGDAVEIAKEASLMVETLVKPEVELRLALPDGPVPMETDVQKIQQVLVNLLINAIKFTERGGIELRAQTEDDHVVFSVSDTGIGIPTEEFERIFEPFTQLDTGYTRTVRGTGLGLSICRHMVGLLGGDIRVRSTLREGSTFTVRVPSRWSAPASN